MTQAEARAALVAILARTPLHQPVVLPHVVALGLLESEKGEADDTDPA